MSYLGSLRARSIRPARRRTILALALLACFLQAWRFTHPEPLISTLTTAARSPAHSPSRAEGGAGAAGGSPAAPQGHGSHPGPTLTVPPPPGVPIPEGAVLLYESPGLARSPASPALDRQLYPNDLLRGIVILEQEGGLSLSREQARSLLPVVRELGEGYREMREVRELLLETLTPEQLRWLEENRPEATDLPAGAPEQTADPLARKASEALRGR